MKKLLAPVVLMLSTLPFAFWKLEGPFYDQNIDYSDYSVEKITLLNEGNFNKDLFNHTDPDFVKYPHLYMYDENTSCSLVYASDESTQLIQAAIYFMNTAREGVQNPYFYMVRKKLDKLASNLNGSNLYKIDKIEEIVKNVYSTLPSKCGLKRGAFNVTNQFFNSMDQKDKNIPDLIESELALSNEVKLIILNQKEQRTLSGVTITSVAGKVKITQNKTKGFQKELGNYFKKKVDETNAASSSSSVKSKITQKELDLLNGSTILAILSFMRDSMNNDSILWGLAKNNTTKKIFHWITDLENDLSVLTKEEV